VKVLFNCTTNVVGGGSKNASIFIRHAIHDDRFNFQFAISAKVKSILESWNIDTSGMELFQNNPARRMEERNRLRRYEQEFAPDIVYTMAGPAYVRFRATHLMGISNPHITHGNLDSFAFAGFPIGTLKALLSTLYKMVHARRADKFIFQTEVSRRGFCKRLKVARDRTYLVPNAVDDELAKTALTSLNPSKHSTSSKRTKVIFCPAAPYPHKALSTIPYIAIEMKRLDCPDFLFLLTIPKGSDIFLEIKNVLASSDASDNVSTIGEFNYSNARKHYSDADVVFVPSILETFSATYLEAFVYRKPLVVAKKQFARDICEDAAEYVDPLDFKSTAEIFSILLFGDDVCRKLIEKGSERLASFVDQRERYEMIAQILLSHSE